jgi:hypothetical protein
MFSTKAFLEGMRLPLTPRAADGIAPNCAGSNPSSVLLSDAPVGKRNCQDDSAEARHVVLGTPDEEGHQTQHFGLCSVFFDTMAAARAARGVSTALPDCVIPAL